MAQTRLMQGLSFQYKEHLQRLAPRDNALAMVFSGLLFTTIEMHPISHLLLRRGNMIQHLRTIIVILLAFLETLEAPVPTCAQTFKTILMQMVIAHKSTPTDYLARLLPNAVQRVKEIQNV